jgi:hypothetical protein
MRHYLVGKYTQRHGLLSGEIKPQLLSYCQADEVAQFTAETLKIDYIGLDCPEDHEKDCVFLMEVYE